jgi:hypothetical protein
MKRLCVALLFASLSIASLAQTAPQPGAAAAPAPPAHPASPEQIREYFQMVHLDQTVHAVMDQMLKASRAQAPPYLPDVVWEDMTKTFGSYDLLAEMIPIYQRHLSHEDMVSILAFYRTEGGRHLVEAQPAMVAEAQAVFPAVGRKLGQEVAARHMEEIQAAKKKFDDEHAPSTPSTPAPPTPH